MLGCLILCKTLVRLYLLPPPPPISFHLFSLLLTLSTFYWSIFLVHLIFFIYPISLVVKSIQWIFFFQIFYFPPLSRIFCLLFSTDSRAYFGDYFLFLDCCIDLISIFICSHGMLELKGTNLSFLQRRKLRLTNLPNVTQ